MIITIKWNSQDEFMSGTQVLFNIEITINVLQHNDKVQRKTCKHPKRWFFFFINYNNHSGRESYIERESPSQTVRKNL